MQFVLSVLLQYVKKYPTVIIQKEVQYCTILNLFIWLDYDENKFLTGAPLKRDIPQEFFGGSWQKRYCRSPSLLKVIWQLYKE